MCHYIEDKDFLRKMKAFCADIVNRLVQRINNDGEMTAKAYLIGSGKKNLITQNGNESVDLDYNRQIDGCFCMQGNEIKKYVMEQFNYVLEDCDLPEPYCKDSKSVITLKKKAYIKGKKTEFGIDIAIVRQNGDCIERLIHRKTGYVCCDEWYWNQVPNSRSINEKVKKIKDDGLWNEVRDVYLKKKNMYLSRQKTREHPSFNVYIETVNEIYNKHFECKPCVPAYLSGFVHLNRF